MPIARSLVLTILCMQFLTDPASAQKLPTGAQVLTFHSDIDDTDQPYAIYLPTNFDATRHYPLVISLHGAGSNHRLNLQRVFGKSNAAGETDAEASRAFADIRDVDYIVASPYARGTMGYQGVAEKDVLDVLADVKRRFPIDDDRVYLTGLSMGGGGTLWLGLSRPDVWAAIAPVCPAPPTSIDALAGNALNVPVHFFHGDADPVVPVDVSRSWVDRLRVIGAHVEYEEYEGVGHNSWDPAYADGRIFDWFDQFERNRFPDRVRFTSDRYATDRAYWVRLDQLTPGTHASIDARFMSPGVIDIETEALGAFTVMLAGHPSHQTNSPFHVSIDGKRFVVEGDTLSFHRVGDEWALGGAPPRDGIIKRNGLEGPMSRVVARRHVYVYGTLGAASQSEVEQRQAQAVEAGTWSSYRGWFLNRVMVFPRIISDQEVRPSDVADGSLVLLGTRATNSIIADLADRLPLHLEADPTRYGLTYIYPIDGQYVLISSGVPWWKHQIQNEDTGWTFGGDVPALMLSNEADFILWDDHHQKVIASGRFDDEWDLPEGVLRTMGDAVIR